MPKCSLESFLNRGQISSKSSKPVWSFFLRRATEVHLRSDNERPRDIEDSMTITLDTRKSNFENHSGSDFIFDSLWYYFITKCCSLITICNSYYKMRRFYYASFFCYKMRQFYYNLWQLLQNRTLITNWDNNSKMRWYSVQWVWKFTKSRWLLLIAPPLFYF